MSDVSETQRRYEITATLGKGGFGTVYRAQMEAGGGFKKQVALKVLNPDANQMADEYARRMRDEARMLGLIRHRAIVQVDGLVKMGDRWAVVMEYIEGVDIGTLQNQGTFPVGPALEIVSEVAGALQAAYNTTGPEGPLRLLHRDIKPSNIQLTPQGEVKLLDFGVARANFAGRESQTRSLRFGSMGYLAPERMDGVDGPGGDIYALGITFWEIVCCDRFGKNFVNRKKHDENILQKLNVMKQVVGPKHGDLVAGFAQRLLQYDAEQRPDAREIERLCAELRGDIKGQKLLRDWAESVVPGMMNAHKAQDDEMTGAVLTEGGQLVRPKTGSAAMPSASPPGTPAAAAAESGSAIKYVVIIAVVAILVVGVVGVGSILGMFVLGALAYFVSG